MIRALLLMGILWAGTLVPEIKDGYALVSLELDPKGIGCVVQRP